MSNEEVMEAIDTDASSILRFAAKHYQNIAVICDLADYGKVLKE